MLDPGSVDKRGHVFGTATRTRPPLAAYNRMLAPRRAAAACLNIRRSAAFLLVASGGCGIRTHEEAHAPYRCSRPPPSATRRTLQAGDPGRARAAETAAARLWSAVASTRQP